MFFSRGKKELEISIVTSEYSFFSGLCPLAHFFALFIIIFNFFISHLIKKKSGKVGRKPANPHECSLFSAHFWFLKVGKTRANGHFFAVFSGFSKKENGQNIHKTRKKWAKAHFSKQKWADNIHYFYSFFTCPKPSENCSATVSNSLQSAPDRYRILF